MGAWMGQHSDQIGEHQRSLQLERTSVVSWGKFLCFLIEINNEATQNPYLVLLQYSMIQFLAVVQ